MAAPDSRPDEEDPAKNSYDWKRDERLDPLGPEPAGSERKPPYIGGNPVRGALFALVLVLLVIACVLITYNALVP
ncbi:hypothetical protein [Hoyosella subflava]|uniref:Uncharacterized protein n=1 Tax=Hoyosella subflava (strain DSM 45089 / JCM 17490 / NBRC 109087 / DQS3-9A1) TaxID=443218 RepID=F6ENY8_HOYSD|nr:hypothetical protein [Hoyosella subflava]AEF40454.1 hypothetical protein AS9A_2005 [Hoyosella subflava DQS3-9A1]